MTAVQLTITGEAVEPVRTVHVREHERRVSGPPSAPLSRNTDPVTSRAAAESVDGDKTEAGILAVFACCRQPLTNDELVAMFRALIDTNACEGTVKSARSRLSRDGYLRQAGEGTSHRGRRMSKWILAAMEDG